MIDEVAGNSNILILAPAKKCRKKDLLCSDIVKERKLVQDIHDIQTVGPSSARMQFAIAHILDFRIFSSDVSQAYLHNTNRLMKKVYITISKEVSFFRDQSLKLLNVLYDLTDSFDYSIKINLKHPKTMWRENSR